MLTVCDPCVLSEPEVQHSPGHSVVRDSPSVPSVPERDPQATSPAFASASLKQKHSARPCVMLVCVCDCRWSVISTGRAVEQKHTAWFKCPCWIQWNWPPTASEPSLSIRYVCVNRWLSFFVSFFHHLSIFFHMTNYIAFRPCKKNAMKTILKTTSFRCSCWFKFDAQLDTLRSHKWMKLFCSLILEMSFCDVEASHSRTE